MSTLSLDFGAVLKNEDIVLSASDVRGIGDVKDGSFREAAVVAVVPIALEGMGGELFSRDGILGRGLGFGELGFCGSLFSKTENPTLTVVDGGLTGQDFWMVGVVGNDGGISCELLVRVREIVGDFASIEAAALSLGKVEMLVALETPVTGF